MASLNTSHHQDGGVLLYSGEIVLLYCDKVNCDIDNIGNSTGRLYLTTHRIVFTSQPINQNSRLMSLAAPFYAMFDLGLEQPVFGANYIRGKVRTNSSQNTSALTQNQFTFKLKFSKGGACEFGRGLSAAAKQASSNAQQSGWGNNYNFTTSSAAQYYQAPSSIYQPNYPIGFVLPNQVFNDVPQNGTIYYQNAPPPYPGILNNNPQQAGAYAQVYPIANPSSSGSVYETNRSNYPQMYPQPQPWSNPGQSPMNAPPPYEPGFNTNPPNQNNFYQQNPPQAYQQNNINYQQQYPNIPQQGGYVPHSVNNNTYPNVPYSKFQ